MPYGSKHCLRRYSNLQITANYTPTLPFRRYSWIPKKWLFPPFFSIKAPLFHRGIVHLTGGVAGLAGTMVLGPRKGRFEQPEDFEAHNLPLVVCLGWDGMDGEPKW